MSYLFLEKRSGWWRVPSNY